MAVLKKTLILVGLSLLAFSIVVGCGKTPIETTDGNADEDAMDLERLEEKLEEKGYQVVEPEPEEGVTPHTFFSVYPTYLEVDDKRIAVYEYNKVEDAKKDAKTISKDGFEIGNSVVEWIDDPHFYQSGRLIVGYIGSDNEFLKDLEAILGESLTD